MIELLASDASQDPFKRAAESIRPYDEGGRRLMTMMMITGANQGGKSTFPPSMGIAQLMMQSGLFVSGKQFRAGLVEGLFTHFKREEDTSMPGGKFDEQLSRISGIVDMPTPHAMVLFNDSFASTTGRKGPEIARQIVCAYLDSGIKVWLVRHLFVLACRLKHTRLDDALFLRAERKEEAPGHSGLWRAALDKSCGKDLFDKILTDSASERAGPMQPQ
jgi:hypothetical protein